MPTLTTPLIGSYNNRSFAAVSGKDQFAKGCILTPIVNKQSRTVTYYVEKRTGYIEYDQPSSGSLGKSCYFSPALSKVYSVFVSGSVYTLYESNGSTTVNCGIISSALRGVFFTEIVLSGITNILITAIATTTTGTGWFLPSDAIATTAYTADGNNSTTITDLKVAGIASVAGLYVGQLLAAGANIAVGSRIASINAGAFSAVLTLATTGGAFNDLAITKEPIAKIIDADFPADIVGGFAVLDGYANIGTVGRRVYESDLNSVISWGASNYLTCDKYPGVGRGVFRYKNMIAAINNGSIEFLYNAGNPSGSTLSSSDSAIGDKNIPPRDAWSCTNADDSLYFVGGDNNIYKIEGYSAKRLNAIGTSLASSNDIPVVSNFTYNKITYLNIACTIPDGVSLNYWYAVDHDIWIDSRINTVRAVASCDPTVQTFFVLMDTSGKVFYLRDDLGVTSSFLDNGAAFTMSNQLATDMGTQERKFPTRLSLLADEQASGSVDVSWSDNGGTTYSVARSIPLTRAALMFLTSLGSFEGTRLWKFEHSANTPFRGKLVKIDY